MIIAINGVKYRTETPQGGICNGCDLRPNYFPDAETHCLKAFNTLNDCGSHYLEWKKVTP